MSHYTNPVLDADWPDPDVVRHSDEYVMVVSSFNRAPGLPVLTSADLVSWEVVSHALPQVPPVEHYRIPRHGGGVWAPSIRVHGGNWFITYPDPDHGVLVVTAQDPRGPWEEPRVLLPGSGIIDPCPLWDDDGRAYLVHGWARSRSGIMNRLTVVEVDPGLTRLLSPPRTVVDGDCLPGYRTLEGPKFYKRDGWYWIFAPAGGVATGWQSVFRSRHVFGPYEDRVVLAQGSTPVNGPHQGAWVDTPKGEDWFLHFQDRGVFGRVVHLQPMRWSDDGWPVIGDGADDATTGTPVVRHGRPAVPGPVTPQREPRRSDDFTGTRLGLQWYWQANPDADWLALEGDGLLRLRWAPEDTGDLRRLPRVLGQQLPGQPSEWTTTVQLDPNAPAGTRAGLVVLGAQYAWAGIMQTPVGPQVLCRRSEGAGTEITLGQGLLPTASATAPPRVGLRASCDADGLVTFAWRLEDAGNGSWVPFQAAFQATAGQWVGADIGLFATAPLGSAVCSPSRRSAEGHGPRLGEAAFGPVDVRMGVSRGEQS